MPCLAAAVRTKRKPAQAVADRRIDVIARSLRAHRLFAADYSTTGQQRWRSPDNPFWADDYRGLLRFDSLTSEKLVVPDSHVFDGPFFPAQDPHALLDALKCDGFEGPARLPLEIRARRSTLAESLADLLRRADSDRLNGFIFKTIEDETLRRDLAWQLRLTPASVLDAALDRTGDPAEAVSCVLMECLRRLDVPERADDVIEPLWEAWAKWLEVDSLPGLVVPWGEQRFRLADALSVDPIPEGRLSTHVGGQAQHAAEQRVRHGSSYRGDVFSDLASLRMRVADPDELAEVELVERWYSRGRYRAIAWQHRATCVQPAAPWRAVTALQALWEEALGRSTSDRAEIPSDVVTTLGELTGEQYAELVYTHRRDLQNWWREGDRAALLRIADALAALVPITPSRTKRIGVSEIIGEAGPAGGVVAGAAVGGVVGAAVGGAIGMLAKIGAAAVKTPTERDLVRNRIVEVWTYRGAN